MKLSSKAYDQLVEAQVDVGMMAKAYNEGVNAREIKSERVGQSRTAFSRSETARIVRGELGEATELALSIAAFDAAMARAEKTWGKLEWFLPELMLYTAIRYWPYKPADKPTDKP